MKIVGKILDWYFAGAGLKKLPKKEQFFSKFQITRKNIPAFIFSIKNVMCTVA